MKISTKGRYGVRALMDLAINSQDQPVALKDISERQNISLKYLEQIFILLKKEGLVKSTKGAKGGYILGLEPKNITVLMLITALEGECGLVDDNEKPPERSERFLLERVWLKMNRAMTEVAAKITLLDIVEDYRNDISVEETMFYI